MNETILLNDVISTEGRNLFSNYMKDFSVDDSFEMTGEPTIEI